MNIPKYFDELLLKHQLQGIRADLLASAKMSLRIMPSADRLLSPASTRLGGLPSLPETMDWPVSSRNEPLSFLAQVKLEDVTAPWNRPWLPSEGTLLFFYDADDQPWGSYADYGGWRVVHVREQSSGRNAPPGTTTFNESGVDVLEELTFPAPRSIELDRLPLTEESMTAYFDFRDDYLDQLALGIETSRVLGHPDSIQGCMQRTLQFETRNEKLPPNVYSYYEHPRAAELIPGAVDWILLLQLDSIDALGFMWGDAGRLYFWIHRDHLTEGRFEHVWLQLQCY